MPGRRRVIDIHVMNDGGMAIMLKLANFNMRWDVKRRSDPPQNGGGPGLGA